MSKCLMLVTWVFPLYKECKASHTMNILSNNPLIALPWAHGMDVMLMDVFMFIHRYLLGLVHTYVIICPFTYICAWLMYRFLYFLCMLEGDIRGCTGNGKHLSYGWRKIPKALSWLIPHILWMVPSVNLSALIITLDLVGTSSEAWNRGSWIDLAESLLFPGMSGWRVAQLPNTIVAGNRTGLNLIWTCDLCLLCWQHSLGGWFSRLS